MFKVNVCAYDAMETVKNDACNLRELIFLAVAIVDAVLQLPLFSLVLTK